MNKYPKVEDFKSEIPDLKNIEVKVENQTMEGENVTFIGNFSVKGGTDLSQALKEVIAESNLSDGAPKDVTGTPEGIKFYDEAEKIKQEDLLKILQDPNTKSLEVSGSYVTQETNDKILQAMNKLRDNTAKNNDVKPK